MSERNCLRIKILRPALLGAFYPIGYNYTKLMIYKVLGIAGSPRKKGNTDILLDEFLQGVREAGGEVEKIYAIDLTCKACLHCDFCLQGGHCCVPDDMDKLYPKIEQANVIVFASPVYFMGPPGQTKMLIDRCQIFWARKYHLGEKISRAEGDIRRGVVLSVGATRGKTVFTGTRITYRWLFDSLELDYWGNLFFEGCDEKGAIRKYPAALQEAYQLGMQVLDPENKGNNL